VAADAAHVVLVRDDWGLVPAALGVARRTMRAVKLNIACTAPTTWSGSGSPPSRCSHSCPRPSRSRCPPSVSGLGPSLHVVDELTAGLALT
jgi:hypothetical protein